MAKLEAAFAALPGVSGGRGQAAGRPSRFLIDQARPTTPLSSSEDGAARSLNPSKTALLMRVGDDLYHYDLETSALSRLTSAPGFEEDPAYSPDGRMVAFTREGNLFVVDVVTQREHQLTTDGGAARFNGRLDWVYQEEIYGRGSFRAFWWSPDSTRLAFLQLDQHAVPEFTLTDHIPTRHGARGLRLPEGGRSQSDGEARAWCGRRAGRCPSSTRRSTPAADHLIVNVVLVARLADVVYSLQDREQTWLDLNRASAASGATRTLLRETTRAWVDNQGDPTVAEGRHVPVDQRAYRAGSTSTTTRLTARSCAR